MNTRICLKVGCDKPAEFEIWDTNERRPECGSTEACITHVGELLGSLPPTKPTGPWTIFCIEAAKEK